MPSRSATTDAPGTVTAAFDPLQAFRPLQAAYRALLETVQLPDEYDEDFLAPSREAVKLAWDTVSDCQDNLPPSLPAPRCAATGNGGLTLIWKREPREVALTIANGEATRSHIYLRHAVEDRLEAVSSDALTEALRWMLNGAD